MYVEYIFRNRISFEHIGKFTISRIHVVRLFITKLNYMKLWIFEHFWPTEMAISYGSA